MQERHESEGKIVEMLQEKNHRNFTTPAQKEKGNNLFLEMINFDLFYWPYMIFLHSLQRKQKSKSSDKRINNSKSDESINLVKCSEKHYSDIN